MKYVKTIFLFVIVSLLILTSCSEPTKPPVVTDDPPTVSSVVVSPAQENLVSGESCQFSAVVNGTNNPPQTVNWTVTGKNSNATNISTSGLLSVANNETASILTVVATSTLAPAINGTATVNVLGEGGTWTVAVTSDWNTAVNGVRNGGNNKYHTINVVNNITIPVSAEFTFGSVTGITVKIQGNSTITANASGRLLYINAQQTVVLHDITLQGDDNSASPVVQIGSASTANATLHMEGSACVTGNISISSYKVYLTSSGSTLIMKDNTTISGNGRGVDSWGTFIMQGNAFVTNNTHSSYGAGVRSNGSFTMQDNATVSNNTVSGMSSSETSPRGGGGVYINSGSFTMKDNSKVINNTVNITTLMPLWYTKGGGICFMGSGLFLIENGTISGNTVTSNNVAYGGGIHVDGNATFTMQNGTISGNTATGSSAYGGGISATEGSIMTETAIIMQGGTISDNTVSANSVRAAGGGVYISMLSSMMDSGYFTMSGGVIAGNSVTSTSSEPDNKQGGGFYGELRKTGGTIYGNNADPSLRNTATDGKGHSASRSLTQWRNVTAGPNDNSEDYGFWTND